MTSSCRTRKGLIIHPGAIGDNLMALPLAKLLKEKFALDQIDWIGRHEYTCFYPDRTCVNRIRSLDTIQFHRLFESAGEFDLADKDPLLVCFRDYEYIISFLGHGNADFEQNLLFTVHCNVAAEVCFLPLIRSDWEGSVCDSYIDAVTAEFGMETIEKNEQQVLIAPLPEDFLVGRDLLETAGINPDTTIVLIHPGSGGCEKCWGVENYLTLADHCQADELEAVFLLGPAEIERFDTETVRKFYSFKVLKDFDLTQVVQVLTAMDVIVGNDSGISHLAAAMGKPALTIFGPTDPAKFAPRGLRTQYFQIPKENFQKRCLAYIQKVYVILQQMIR